MIPNHTAIDWINLPLPSTSQSLWQSLHDGKLLSIQSDLMARTVVLEVDVPHIRHFHKLDDGLRFIITFIEVESVRTNTFVEWPGTVPEVQGKSYEEQSRLVEEFQAKGREESIGWNDFMAAFPENTLDIYSSEVAQNESTTAVKIQGVLSGDEYDDKYFNVFIRAQKLVLGRNDDLTLSLEEFTKLGQDFWDANNAQR